MNEATEQVLAKIRKLLARADAEQNDNEHERAIAMRQAMALITKHGLNMAEVEKLDTAEFEGALGKIEVEVPVAYWISSLWHAVAQLHGCMTVKTAWRGRGSTKLTLFGRAVRLTACRAMCEYLTASVQREIKVRHKDMPWMNGNKFSNEFGSGAASGIYSQVLRILAEQAKGNLGDEQVSESRALVVVNQHKQALIDAQTARDAVFPKLRKGGGTRTSGTAAYSQGKEFGRSVGLHAQVGGAKQKLLK